MKGIVEMKRVIILALVAGFAWSLPAQNMISFGPKVGWNSTTLSTDYTDYLNDMKSGFQGGLFFSINLDKIYIQPEAYLSIKRGTLNSSIDDPLTGSGTLNLSQSMTLRTVDLPLLVGYKLLDLKLVRLRLWGGPVASYVLNRDYTLTINGIDQSQVITKEDFKDATWSVQLGAGLDVLMLTFDVGYDFGVQDFMTIRSINDFSLKNNVFFCSLGWRIY
jgi:hypothetical protein